MTKQDAMKNTETSLSEYEQRTLNFIVNNKGLMTSSLTRRMHSMGMTTKRKRASILNSLENTLKLIQSEIKPFELGKRGRRPKIYYATEKGNSLIKQIIINNRK